MKTFLSSIRLTFMLLILLAGIFPLLVMAIGKLTRGSGNGVTVESHGRIAGYENIGQQFVSGHYFWGRPSAVNYNAAGSGGSNKAPSNPEYLQTVQTRIDTFLAHHPGLQPAEIPVDLVTASGSGLDPHISPQAAKIQVKRIAKARGMSESEVSQLVEEHIEKPLLGLFGPTRVNVLKLNIALDQLNKK